MTSALELDLCELRSKLRDSEVSYLAHYVSVVDGSLYLRVDTLDNTVEENESEYHDLLQDFISLGYEIKDHQIEHDCITGTIVKLRPIIVIQDPVHSIAFSSDVDICRPFERLTGAKIYAWCESLDKGAQRCRESSDSGDAATLNDIATYFRNLPQAK